jgi:hypothetical protein
VRWPYLERLNKEVKRRTDVVAVFPNPEVLLRLASAVLVQAHDEWQATDRRLPRRNHHGHAPTHRSRGTSHGRTHHGMI